MRTLALTLACTVVGLAGPAFAFQSVRVQVLDRGQADGIVIRTPNEEWIVIDAGTNDDQADYMEEMGIETVALAVVSHRHFDHHGGMDEVIEQFEVERFYGNMEDCPNRTSDDTWREALEDEGAEQMSPGESVTIDGVTFEFLPVPANAADCPDHENDNTRVVRMTFGDFSMLFTGDVELDTIGFLVNNHADQLEADVLKASHHGSHNGRTDPFLDAVGPRKIVISVGQNSTHGHPHDEAVDDYIDAVGESDLFCTHRDGTVRVYGFPDGRIMMRTQRDSDADCRHGDGT